MSADARPRLATIVAAAVTGALVFAAGAAWAHTEVQRAEPGPAQQVSGTVDEISLLFVDQIRPGGTIVVADEDGELVPGLTTATLAEDARTLRVGFDPLDRSGRYLVTYTFVAMDGDAGTDSYTFTYEASGGVGTTIRLVVAVAVGAVVAIALVLAFRSRKAAGDAIGE